MGKRLQAPRGTRDLAASDLFSYEIVRANARRVSADNGFEHIETPLFEDVSLFVRGLGESSDAVSKELFLVNGPGDRKPPWALRPEPTAGIVRAYIQHGWQTRPHPQRYWTLGPMFRYDRPQAGRYRQFEQWDVEILGDPGPWTDADLIAMASRFFAAWSIPLAVHVNSIGDAACRPRYRAALVKFLQPRLRSLSPASQWRLTSNPLRVLDDKDLPQSIADAAPRAIDYLCDDCAVHFAAVQQGLTALGIPWELDHRLVRGLDYYTRTTFEIFESGRAGQQDALGGGGRYDGLVEVLGGVPTPGIGFGVGVERTISAISRTDYAVGGPGPRIVAVVGGESNGVDRLKVASRLRDYDVHVVVDGTTRSLTKQLRAVARRAHYAVIVGANLDRLTIRDLGSGIERSASFGDIPTLVFD